MVLGNRPFKSVNAGSSPVPSTNKFIEIGSVAIIGLERRPVKSMVVGSSPITPAKFGPMSHPSRWTYVVSVWKIEGSTPSGTANM